MLQDLLQDLRVTLRGLVRIEEIKPGDRQQLVIDAIPYMVGQTALVEKIVEAVKEDKIADVSDVRNESGREARTRIVIERNVSHHNDIGVELASEHGGRATSSVTLRDNFVYRNRIVGLFMGGYVSNRPVRLTVAYIR